MTNTTEKKANLTVRLTPQEHEIITNKATELGLSISDYVRMACLHAEVKIKVKEGKE